MNRAKKILSKRYLKDFAKVMFPEIVFESFHEVYYNLLERFALGDIKKLIITIPPQHGKSQGSSRLLPAWLLGRDPDRLIAIGSYASTFARKFNRAIQRYMLTPEYQEIFPETKITKEDTRSDNNTYIRTSEEFDIVGRAGNLKAIGRGGQLTGNPVDIMIMDDLYKDFAEANSSVIRESAWDWYINVVKTRLHNDSQELIVFTRWHEDDIIGRLETLEAIIDVKTLKDIEDIPPGAWLRINFSAIKEDEPTDLDPRAKDQVLWSAKHSLENLTASRNLDPFRFECMYQGRPESKEGRLYAPFQTYETIPGVVIKKGNYTDTADTGTDYLCSICYDKTNDNKCYVTDVVFTQEPMEATEKYVPLAFGRAGTKEARIESNNGGRGFSRVVQRASPTVAVHWFHQGANKESRINTNSALVTQNIIMPLDWHRRWPEFHRHVVKYKRIFVSNKFNDAADSLTGIVEHEISKPKARGIRRRN